MEVSRKKSMPYSRGDVKKMLITQLMNGKRLSMISNTVECDTHHLNPLIPPISLPHIRSDAHLHTASLPENLAVADFLYLFYYLANRKGLYGHRMEKFHESAEAISSEEFATAKSLFMVARTMQWKVNFTLHLWMFNYMKVGLRSWPTVKARSPDLEASANRRLKRFSNERVVHNAEGNFGQFISEVQAFAPDGYDSKVAWRVNRSIISRVVRERLRTPPLAVINLARNAMHSLDDHCFPLRSPGDSSSAWLTQRSREGLVQSAVDRISIAGLVEEEVPLTSSNKSSSIEPNDMLPEQMKLKLFESCLGRHVEAMLDAQLHQMLSFFEPFLLEQVDSVADNGQSSGTKRKWDAMEVETNDANDRIRWDQVLTALQCPTELPKKVKNDLPDPLLSRSTLERSRLRLQGLFPVMSSRAAAYESPAILDQQAQPRTWETFHRW
eukprot:scaffold5400_cov159-Ochromonas_danica.AAC.3